MKVTSAGVGQPVKRDDGKWGFSYYVNGNLIIRDSDHFVSDTANAAKQKMREHVSNVRRQNGLTWRK